MSRATTIPTQRTIEHLTAALAEVLTMNEFARNEQAIGRLGRDLALLLSKEPYACRELLPLVELYAADWERSTP